MITCTCYPIVSLLLEAWARGKHGGRSGRYLSSGHLKGGSSGRTYIHPFPRFSPLTLCLFLPYHIISLRSSDFQRCCTFPTFTSTVLKLVLLHSHIPSHNYTINYSSRYLATQSHNGFHDSHPPLPPKPLDRDTNDLFPRPLARRRLVSIPFLCSFPPPRPATFPTCSSLSSSRSSMDLDTAF